MVIFCAAPRCRNKQEKWKRISFHNFPSNEVLRQQWLIAMNRDNWTPSKYAKLCSAHFLKDDFQHNFGYKTLKPGVVPSIFKYPPDCSACGKEWMPNGNITFHKFPLDSTQRVKWVRAVQTSRENFRHLVDSVLCSEHFKGSDFTTASKKRLRKHAVPTIFNRPEDPLKLDSWAEQESNSKFDETVKLEDYVESSADSNIAEDKLILKTQIKSEQLVGYDTSESSTNKNILIENVILKTEPEVKSEQLVDYDYVEDVIPATFNFSEYPIKSEEELYAENSETAENMFCIETLEPELDRKSEKIRDHNDVHTEDEQTALSPWKHHRGQPVTTDQKLMAYNVYSEYLENGHSKTQSIKRTAADVGLSERLVWNVVKEIQNYGAVRSQTITRNRKGIYESLNENQKQTIRQIVNDFYERNESPTLDKVCKVIQGLIYETKSLPPMRRTTVHKVLTKLGFLL